MEEGNLEERNVAMKGKDPGKVLTIAKRLTLKHPEGRDFPT